MCYTPIAQPLCTLPARPPLQLHTSCRPTSAWHSPLTHRALGCPQAHPYRQAPAPVIKDIPSTSFSCCLNLQLNVSSPIAFYTSVTWDQSPHSLPATPQGADRPSSPSPQDRLRVPPDTQRLLSGRAPVSPDLLCESHSPSRPTPDTSTFRLPHSAAPTQSPPPGPQPLPQFPHSAARPPRLPPVLPPLSLLLTPPPGASARLQAVEGYCPGSNTHPRPAQEPPPPSWNNRHSQSAPRRPPSARRPLAARAAFAPRPLQSAGRCGRAEERGVVGAVVRRALTIAPIMTSRPPLSLWAGRAGRTTAPSAPCGLALLRGGRRTNARVYPLTYIYTHAHRSRRCEWRRAVPCRGWRRSPPPASGPTWTSSPWGWRGSWVSARRERGVVRVGAGERFFTGGWWALGRLCSALATAPGTTGFMELSRARSASRQPWGALWARGRPLPAGGGSSV